MIELKDIYGKLHLLRPEAIAEIHPMEIRQSDEPNSTALEGSVVLMDSSVRVIVPATVPQMKALLTGEAPPALDNVESVPPESAAPNVG